jgi:hypothetical protein
MVMAQQELQTLEELIPLQELEGKLVSMAIQIIENLEHLTAIIL